MADNGVWPGDDRLDEWDYDLHPHLGEGLRTIRRGPHPEKSGTAATADSIKPLHRRLHGFTDDELKQIVVLPEGVRLEQGATYIDLHDSNPQEFTATADMVASPNHWYVPKSEIDYLLWNRLTGVETPARLDQPDKG